MNWRRRRSNFGKNLKNKVSKSLVNIISTTLWLIVSQLTLIRDSPKLITYKTGFEVDATCTACLSYSETAPTNAMLHVHATRSNATCTCCMLRAACSNATCTCYLLQPKPSYNQPTPSYTPRPPDKNMCKLAN